MCYSISSGSSGSSSRSSSGSSCSSSRSSSSSSSSSSSLFRWQNLQRWCLSAAAVFVLMEPHG